MSHPVRLVCVALVGLAALVATPQAAPARAAAVADPDPLADVGVVHWGQEFRGMGVVVHVPSGRIQVFADWNDVGRYVHFGLGARDGSGACVPTRWVVLDQQHETQAQVYDAAGNEVPVLERFAPLDIPSQWGGIARLRIDPSGWSADCVTAFGTTGPDPASAQVGIRRTRDLGPMTDLGHHPTYLTYPPAFPWQQDTQISYRVDASPNGAWEGLLVPPVPATIQVVVPPDSDLEQPTPLEPFVQDLWVDPVVEGTLTVRPTSEYGVHPEVQVLAAGLQLGAYFGVPPHPNTARVVMPEPPEGWSGTLAGRELWSREKDTWPWSARHKVLWFLDDQWVFIGFAGNPPPATCTEVATKRDRGCHRYYYDAATQQLQFDDLRLEPVTPPGWRPIWQVESFGADTSLGTVPAGTRLDFLGEGTMFECGAQRPVARGCPLTDIRLRLHPDGTYRYTKWPVVDGGKKIQRGTYRFGSGQRLILDPRKFPPIVLDDVIGFYSGGQLVDLQWSWGAVYGHQNLGPFYCDAAPGCPYP